MAAWAELFGSGEKLQVFGSVVQRIKVHMMYNATFRNGPIEILPYRAMRRYKRSLKNMRLSHCAATFW